MIKLICEKCNHIWYTANTSPNQKCGDCGGFLRETKLISVKDIEKHSVCIDKKKSDCTILHHDFN